MKEYIERAALKRELAPYEENDFSQQINVILAIVDAQPAADVALVVRCRECKYFGHIISGENHACKNYQMPYCKPDDFCSRGERRETPTCHDGVCDIPGLEEHENGHD